MPFVDLTIADTAVIYVAWHVGAAAALLLALEVAGKIWFRPEIALTRLHLVELFQEHHPNERAETTEHMDLAIAELRDMKMEPSLERALSHRGILKP